MYLICQIYYNREIKNDFDGCYRIKHFKLFFVLYIFTSYISFEKIIPILKIIIEQPNIRIFTEYHTHTKFRGINFRALAGSEFRGSIFSCGVIFVDTYIWCSRSEINFQLHSYTRNVKFIRISTKMGFLLFPLGYHVSWTYGRGTGNRAKLSSVANCWTVQGSLLYVWKYNKPCVCQETFMQSANLFLRGETIAAI